MDATNLVEAAIQAAAAHASLKTDRSVQEEVSKIIARENAGKSGLLDRCWLLVSKAGTKEYNAQKIANAAIQEISFVFYKALTPLPPSSRSYQHQLTGLADGHIDSAVQFGGHLRVTLLIRLGANIRSERAEPLLNLVIARLRNPLKSDGETAEAWAIGKTLLEAGVDIYAKNLSRVSTTVLASRHLPCGDHLREQILAKAVADIPSSSADVTILPDEILQKILCQLPLAEAIHSRRVCKWFNRLMHENLLSHYFPNYQPEPEALIPYERQLEILHKLEINPIHPSLIDALGGKEAVEKLPLLDIGEQMGDYDEIDFLNATNLSAPVMRGVDKYGRPFVAFCVEKNQYEPEDFMSEKNPKKVPMVSVLFRGDYEAAHHPASVEHWVSYEEGQHIFKNCLKRIAKEKGFEIFSETDLQSVRDLLSGSKPEMRLMILQEMQDIPLQK